MTAKGFTPKYFSFVLHGHIPYVQGHGGWPHGTDWLYEAACETYLPLLAVAAGLREAGIRGGLTIGISPILAEQLSHPDFGTGLAAYIDMKSQAAAADARRFGSEGATAFETLARAWRAWYEDIRRDFEDEWQGDIIGGFRSLQDAGGIEIITCAATHGYLPLFGREESINLQLRTAVATHTRHFGREPRGIWLPECAYRPGYEWRYPLPPRSNRPPRLRPGIEHHLSRLGLKYFIIDTHLLRGGRALGVYAARFDALKRLYDASRETTPPAETSSYSPYRPYYVGATDPGVACFVRDAETGLVVWSGEHGYPGDGWYLDFHKKHYPGGLRYWRVTAAKTDLGAKAVYEPDRVPGRLGENSWHFATLVTNLLQPAGPKSPILVAPYDAELFGHWWFEGPSWLEAVLRALAARGDIRLTTLGDYLATAPPELAVNLPEGSWGEGGFHNIWLNEDTAWSWEIIYEAEEWLAAEARFASNPSRRRILQQALREYLLLTASDWQFLISTWSARDYAEERLRGHYAALAKLLAMLEAERGGVEASPGELAWLTDLERRDCPFPDIKPEWFTPS